MIKDSGGRVRSEQTPDEVAELLRREVSQLSADEREALMLCLRELDDPAVRTRKESNDGGGPVRILDALSEGEYIRPMVDVRAFISDPFYLGTTCDGLYPRLVDDMVELFEGGYKEAILTGSIGWGKCLSISDTYVTEVDTGRRWLLRDLVNRAPLVPSLQDDGRIAASRASKIWRSGVKSCLRLRLTSGQWLEASVDHPVLAPTGWRRMDSLVPGDLVATARSCPEPARPLEISDEEVVSLGLLMADGSLTEGKQEYIKGSAELVALFERNVVSVPGFSGFGRKEFKRGAWYVPCRGLLPWLREWGIDALSKRKRIPGKLFGIPNRQLALLIRAIWTDGNVYLGSPRKLELCLASEGLIDDMQEALRRFGIVARKSYKRKTIKKKDGTVKVYDAWRLQIADVPSLRRFIGEIGPVFGLDLECEKLRASLEGVESNTNWDIVPITREELKDIRRDIGRVSNAEWSKYASLEVGSYMGRDKFCRLVDHFNYTGRYSRFAAMDVVWEKVKEVTDAGPQEVGDLTVPGTANVVANGIIVHNTYFASIAVCRCLYEISCMRDPHRSFGLAKDTNISFVALSISEALAIKVVFENIATKLKASPYFQQHFPFEETKKELRFPHKLWVAARSSTDTSALGLNVFGAVLDEGNFFDPVRGSGASSLAKWGNKDKAQVLYEQLVRRMKSRFQRHGKLPGLMIVVSSKRTRDDFTAKRVKEAANDAEVFVRDYAIYDVKPEAFSKERFHVLVGNETTVSKILAPNEVELTMTKIAESGTEGLLIIDVPEDFRSDFEADLEASVRDIAGVETVSISPFLQQRDRIVACVDKSRQHPYSSVAWDQSKPGDFVWTRIAKRVTVRDGAETFEGWQPIFYPGVSRHVHIDPSLNSDATGVAVGCVIGYKNVERRNYETSEVYTEPAPVVWVDFALRIVPPLGGEIDHGKVRGLVYQLQSHGFPISFITMDQFNSAASLQKFAVKGIEAERLSVDKPPDAYETLKSAIYEGRLLMYDYEPLLEELRTLQKDKSKNKIDHPRGGRKDVADALAGIVFTLTTRYRGAPMGIFKGISQHGGDPEVEEQRQAVESDDFFMPFLQG